MDSIHFGFDIHHIIENGTYHQPLGALDELWTAGNSTQDICDHFSTTPQFIVETLLLMHMKRDS